MFAETYWLHLVQCSERATSIRISSKLSGLHCFAQATWENYGTWSSSWRASFPWLPGMLKFCHHVPNKAHLVMGYSLYLLCFVYWRSERISNCKNMQFFVYSYCEWPLLFGHVHRETKLAQIYRVHLFSMTWYQQALSCSKFGDHLFVKLEKLNKKYLVMISKICYLHDWLDFECTSSFSLFLFVQTDTKKISAVSIFFETMPYRLDESTGYIDYDQVACFSPLDHDFFMLVHIRQSKHVSMYSLTNLQKTNHFLKHV